MASRKRQSPTASQSPAVRPAGTAPRTGIFVAIGGSAGALEPLQSFFDHMPADSGLVFVVVQHLERHHPSVLAELLARHTAMPVKQAEGGVRAQPNHVYIIAPNTVLSLERGLLQVASPLATGARKPVDAFMVSLAEDQGEGAVGVILSGTGADGTIGMRVIKEHGGLTLAQAPATARYDDMPQSAITAGLADHVLPVEEMPARLLDHAKRLTQIRRRDAKVFDDEIDADLGTICGILHRRTGHDFSHYKKGTLLRRIGRRVRIHDGSSVAGYLRRLEAEPFEAELLLRDLLIGVTHFFRDPEVFLALADQAIRPILDSTSTGAAVRAWVPGCASGEETYSIAILLLEQLAHLDVRRTVQIFGTDIDTELLATAREGRYPVEIREHVSPERLERFFTRDGAFFQVSKELRHMCTFSAHSLIKDPPFSSLDLISCRNLLIYMGPDLQKKLVPLFHFGLRPGGFLLLGPSEDLAAHAELFTTIDKKHRLFRRSDVVERPPLELPLASRTVPAGRQIPPSLEPAKPRQEPILSQAFDRMIREEYAPPSVVVNEQGEILYMGGATSRYLQPREGPPTSNLLDQARTSLRVELRAALSMAVKTRGRVVRDNVQVEVDGHLRLLRLTVRPLPGILPESGLYAVVMQETVSTEAPPAEEQTPAREVLIIEQLEDELRSTREDLQAAMESLETSNEELKSTNEELTSTNEELQSANEELQSSREELQTINDELREKMQALDAANSDLQHHYTGTQVATIFVDRELRVTNLTPAATALFHLQASDVGRPFSDIAVRFRNPRLVADAREVLRTEAAVERRVQASDSDRWFLLRLVPYLAKDKRVAGVGITFIDITDLHRAEEAERYYGQLSDAVFVWRLDDGIETWNRGAEELYGFSFHEVRGRLSYEVLKTTQAGSWKEIEQTLRAKGRWEGELEHRTRDGRAVIVSAKLELTRGEDGVERVLEADRDITDRRMMEEALRDADRRKNEFLGMLSHELRNPLAPIKNSLYILQRVAPGGAEALQALNIADRQIEQLIHLVDDLLDVTRITREKILLQRHRLELNELVQSTVEDHSSVLEAYGLNFDVKQNSTPVFIDADRNRIAQILGNLLQNAAKFTPRGGRVQVSVSSREDTGQAVIRVTDTGIGMEPETLAHLFQPFMQAANSLGRSRGGLGLGLALVKGLVELHGGKVIATSAGPGRGAEITVYLPLAPRDMAFHPADSPAAARPAGRRRVLIIDDNVDATTSLQMLLTLEGHDIAVAHSGSEGLATALEFHPDLVLCDIGLPGMDGYEVAAAFRSNPVLANTFLAALTGYGLPEDVQRTADAGFACHLTKPMKFDELRQVIASVPASHPEPPTPDAEADTAGGPRERGSES